MQLKYVYVLSLLLEILKLSKIQCQFKNNILDWHDCDSVLRNKDTVLYLINNASTHLDIKASRTHNEIEGFTIES